MLAKRPISVKHAIYPTMFVPKAIPSPIATPPKVAKIGDTKDSTKTSNTEIIFAMSNPKNCTAEKPHIRAITTTPAQIASSTLSLKA